MGCLFGEQMFNETDDEQFVTL